MRVDPYDPSWFSTPSNTRIVPITEPDEHASAVMEEIIGELICAWDEWGLEADERKTPGDWQHKFRRYYDDAYRTGFTASEPVRALAVVALAYLVVTERRRNGMTPQSPPPPPRWRADDFEDRF
jgi:hypothetical protein